MKTLLRILVVFGAAALCAVLLCAYFSSSHSHYEILQDGDDFTFRDPEGWVCPTLETSKEAACRHMLRWSNDYMVIRNTPHREEPKRDWKVVSPCE